jgi:hypothetical protein
VMREWGCWEGEEEQRGLYPVQAKVEPRKGQRLRNADMGCV